MKKTQQDNIWGPEKFNREMKSLGELTSSFGLPRLIITGFLVLLFILAPVAGVDFFTQITNVANRFSWNAVMVLAMVPMIHSGCGLNFGLPLGLVSGLLGATLSIQFGFTGAMSFVMAIVIATPFAFLFGGGYGWLLNKIKGGEMMIGDVCRLLRHLVHVHDVAAAAVYQPHDGLGYGRQGSSYNDLPRRLLR